MMSCGALSVEQVEQMLKLAYPLAIDAAKKKRNRDYAAVMRVLTEGAKLELAYAALAGQQPTAATAQTTTVDGLDAMSTEDLERLLADTNRIIAAGNQAKSGDPQAAVPFTAMVPADSASAAGETATESIR
jgi:hypothetical protein